MPERRRWAAANVDDVRQLLVNEPRGHADMYGGFVTPPDDADGDLGVVFFHNEGYSTACGHGTIALVTWAIDTGRVATEPGAREVAVTVDVPSGRLACTARLDGNGRVEAVRFRNVPSFVLARDVEVETSRGPADPRRRVRRGVLRLDGCADARAPCRAASPPRADRPATRAPPRPGSRARGRPPRPTGPRGHLRRHLLGARRGRGT